MVLPSVGKRAGNFGKAPEPVGFLNPLLGVRGGFWFDECSFRGVVRNLWLFASYTVSFFEREHFVGRLDQRDGGGMVLEIWVYAFR